MMSGHVSYFTIQSGKNGLSCEGKLGNAAAAGAALPSPVSLGVSVFATFQRSSTVARWETPINFSEAAQESFSSISDCLRIFNRRS